MSSRPTHRAVFAVCVLVMVVHQAVRWGWFIDDAAICFAYARNLANGDGIVPWPGGERIEAVSDPLWIGVLALFHGVGLDGFMVAKPLAMGFGVGTLWIVWQTAQRALPNHRGPGALIAPIALAANSQFAIWSASGLENALFCLLLAGAIHRTTIEPERPGFPWSSVLYLLLALTRPEGLLYAAVGGLFFAAGTRDWRRAGTWLATFTVPLGLVEIARIQYFAWPLPNTFYAKIASRGVAPLNWDGRGWNQLREWADRLWYGYGSPLYLLALTGLRGWRPRVGFGVLGLLALSLLWPGTAELRATWFWPALPEPPSALVLVRLLALIGAGLGLPLLALGTPAGSLRALCGFTVTTGLLFSILADGDWMGAFRWMSLVTPALAVLFAVGVTTTIDALRDTVRWDDVQWLAAAILVGLLLPPNLSQTRDHVFWNFKETTRSVKLRVDHTWAILRRTFYDAPVTNLEVDQGAHLWWAPDYREVDMAMLVDIPMARHWYQQRAFIQEYVFDEMRPTFAHVGGWWAKHTGLRRYPGWDATYFELPSYENVWPPGPFRNVFGRRELVVTERWSQPENRRVPFDWDVVLEGVALPAPWVPDLPGYLEVPFSVTAPREPGQDVTALVFLSRDGRLVASWDLPMGYGFYPMDQWKVGEVFRGRHAVPIPASIGPGTYDLGVVLLGPRGRVIPALEPSADPVFAAGEVRFQGIVEVVAPEALGPRIDAVRATTLSDATSGACEAAEDGWIHLQRHRPQDWAWHDAERPRVARAIADCWARRAEHQPDPTDTLAHAHRWDHRSPELARVGAPIGDRLFAEGRAARDREDWDTAYDRFASLLRFQPWRAWARRWAEEARDHRLDLVDDVRIGIGGEDDLRAVEGPP